ncbi:hypothetical protein J437_LFUL009218 [Ladona fulva]|uniref:Uncharacterized protein n=1 Tax=Ladona fulva TaxID=123851 RepID=A0A8K0K771_LADFU|nr:hypothetical protein J437_LFUL009218 [Ladona fulva]
MVCSSFDNHREAKIQDPKMAGSMTNFFMMLAGFLLMLVAVSALPPSTEAPLCQDVSCPTSYMPGNFLAANPHDPCTYCQCIWGRPVVMHCPKHLGWSEMYSQCIPSPQC